MQTDKASLLAEVIQHVKELKRQTSEITEEACPLPTESDELTVDASSDENGRLLVRASLCCDDRADLLPDLIRALKALRLRALKAEITTLGGRVKNVLVITADDSTGGCEGAAGDDQQEEAAPMSPQHTVASIQEALRAVMERTASSSSAAEESGAAASSGGGAGLKRQRTTSLSAILENKSISKLTYTLINQILRFVFLLFHVSPTRSTSTSRTSAMLTASVTSSAARC